MLAYIVVAVISVVCTYIIMRFHQKMEIARARDDGYSEGYDTAIKAGVAAAVAPAETVADLAPWEDETSILYKVPEPEPVATQVYPAYREEPYPAPAPVYGYSYTGSAALTAIQEEVDRFSEEMDRDTEAFMARLAMDNQRFLANAMSGTFGNAEETSPIPVIVARETVTREVIVAGRK